MKKYNLAGWKRSLPDKRDYLFSSMVPFRSDLPSHIDLSSNLPPVYNQLSLGSCTAFATAALLQSLLKKEKGKMINPGELFLYYFTRKLEGTLKWDSGASIRNSMKAANKFGISPEKYWPYKINKFKQAPSPQSRFFGKHYRLNQYMRVQQTIPELKQSIAQGFPVVFGFMVYDSFRQAAKKGIMPIPHPQNEYLWGGHAVTICGFSDDKRVFKCRNSWGRNWGDDGYFYMPYDFIVDRDFADDFWTAHDVIHPKRKIKFRPAKRKKPRHKKNKIRSNVKR